MLEAKSLQLGPGGEIHVYAGAADDEVGGECAPRCVDFDAAVAYAGIVARGARDDAEAGVPGAAIVGLLRKALAQAEHPGHEAPAPGIVEVAQVGEKAAEGRASDRAARPGRCRAGRARAPRGRRAPAPWRHCPGPRRRRRRPPRPCPRREAKSISSAQWARSGAGRPAISGGIHHRPMPSWPVASRILRAWRISVLPSARWTVAASRPPAGAISTRVVSLRTGVPVTSRTQSR